MQIMVISLEVGYKIYILCEMIHDNCVILMLELYNERIYIYVLHLKYN